MKFRFRHLEIRFGGFERERCRVDVSHLPVEKGEAGAKMVKRHFVADSLAGGGKVV